MAEDKIEHSMYDVNGDMYKVFVTPGEAAALNNDHHKQYRLMNKIKSGQALGTICAVPANKNTKGRNRWSKESTNVFLGACLPHRAELQKRFPDASVWTAIAEVLNEGNTFDFGPDELRSKMRHLKNGFAKGDESWIYYQQMKTIFHEDDPDRDLNDKENAVDGTEETPSFFVDLKDKASHSSPYGRISVSRNLSFQFPNGPAADIDFAVHDQETICSQEDLDQDDLFANENSNNNSAANRSPMKKKGKNDGAALSATPRTPQKTPKRKCSQSDLIWPEPALTLFFKECLKVKKDVVSVKPPFRVWKDLSSILSRNGHPKYTPDLCRDKFLSFNLFFSGTLLGKGGLLGGVKCPHYDVFCKIHDIPEDYIVPIEINCGSTVPVAEIWEEPANNYLLIDLYEEKKTLFESSSSGIRHNLLYTEIAVAMSAFNVILTGKDCRARMDKLKATLREEFDKTKKTGAGPSKWEFFLRMSKVFENSPTLEAPVELSLGSNITYRVEGAPVMETTRNSRTRPSAPTKTQPPASGNKKPQRKTIFQSALQEERERAAGVQEMLADEIRLMREGFESRGDRRLFLMQTLIDRILPPSDK